MLNPSDINSELGRHYLAVWRTVLPVFLNWSDDQVLEWANQWRESLQAANRQFFNRTPISVVVPLLISQSLKARLSTMSYHQLKWSIEMAMEQGNSFFDRNPDYDWGASRGRVEAILKAHGEKLPAL